MDLCRTVQDRFKKGAIMKIDISEKEKKPGFSAAYVICEKGKESRYYTELGGGCARPFKVLDFLYTMTRSFAAASYMNRDYSYLSAVPLLEQFRADEWTDGKESGPLFHVYDSSTDPGIKEIPFLIMLDLDRNSLGIWFNDNFKEFGALAGKDITIPRYSATYDEMMYAADCYKEEHPGIPYLQCMEEGYRKTIMDHLGIKEMEEQQIPDAYPEEEPEK